MGVPVWGIACLVILHLVTGSRLNEFGGFFRVREGKKRCWAVVPCDAYHRLHAH